MFKILDNKNGFTLVEMLVTVTVFSLIVGTSTGIFVSAIKIQRYNLATQELLNQTSYALEYMDRFLRMARKDMTGTCLTVAGAGANYENPSDNTAIKFLNYNGQCQEFYREWNAAAQVYQLKVDLDTTIPWNELPLTSEKFNVTSLVFQISGEEQTDFLQPRVTIFMTIEAVSSAQPKPKLTVQTTISQRALDLEE